MKLLTKNVKIALTVIAGLILLYWGINYLKGVNLLTPVNRYYTELQSTDGLLEAAPVTVNGFQVGQVREITYDYSKNKIMVMISMDKDMKVPEGSSLNLVSGLMGGASLVLNLGTGPALEPGSNIPTTDVPGLMDHVTENMLPKVTDMLPKVAPGQFSATDDADDQPEPQRARCDDRRERHHWQSDNVNRQPHGPV